MLRSILSIQTNTYAIAKKFHNTISELLLRNQVQESYANVAPSLLLRFHAICNVSWCTVAAKRLISVSCSRSLACSLQRACCTRCTRSSISNGLSSTKIPCACKTALQLQRTCSSVVERITGREAVAGYSLS